MYFNNVDNQLSITIVIKLLDVYIQINAQSTNTIQFMMNRIFKYYYTLY